MAKEPDIEDLPEDKKRLDSTDLEGVVGGMPSTGGHYDQSPKQTDPGNGELDD